jgi:hypothetical protein
LKSPERTGGRPPCGKPWLIPQGLIGSSPPNVNHLSSKPCRALAAALVVTQSLGPVAFAQSAAQPPVSAPTTEAVPAPPPVPAPPIASPPAVEAVAAPAPGVDVHFDANEEDIALMVRREGSVEAPARYTYICIAPCDARLLPGRARMALAPMGYHPIEVKEPVLVSAATTLRGTYRSRTTMRTVGITIAIFGAIVGGIVASVGGSVVPQDAGTGWGLIVGGASAGLGAAVYGTIMFLQKDQASIEIMPLAVPRIGARPGFANERTADLPAGEGVGLRLRF